MLFNSYEFIFVYLPATLAIFFSLSKFRLTTLATAWLVISSLVFYAYWNIVYLPLLLISIVFNYQIGRSIGDAKPASQRAKILLAIGIGLNLSLLAYYKYTNFFISSFSQVLNTDWTVPNIILPLGISFYTFTQTAYLVDAYRGETKNYNFLTYSLFVTFFPHLIAGPVLHHKSIIPQFQQLRNFLFSQKNTALGLTLFILGLSKKVLIADNLAPWVSPVFNNAEAVSFLEAWVGALSYTFQLYFDFSGYSDMAIGLGLMLNIQLPINFNSPYKATSISDFWRRWHITLSNFLRDYLYIPLGGNRQGEIRRYANLFTTMLLGGLWHGAGWTFVVWGGLHGLFLSINHYWRRLGRQLPHPLAWVITFGAVVTTWVIFRAASLHDGIEILKAMVGLKGVIFPTEYQSVLPWLSRMGGQFKKIEEFAYLPQNYKQSLTVLCVLLIGVIALPNTQQILKWFKPNLGWAIVLSSLALSCLLSLNRISEFLYFQF